MHQVFTFWHVFYLAIAVVLDVVANVFLKLSGGFKHKIYAIVAILFVLAAFTAFSFAIQAIPLSIAYGLWGGAGLIATALAGVMLFRERIRFTGWIGIIMIISGVILLKSAAW